MIYLDKYMTSIFIYHLDIISSQRKSSASLQKHFYFSLTSARQHTKLYKNRDE